MQSKKEYHCRFVLLLYYLDEIKEYLHVDTFLSFLLHNICFLQLLYDKYTTNLFLIGFSIYDVCFGYFLHLL